MKSLFVILVLLSFQWPLMARQTCDCNGDLAFVRSMLEKTPSYKDQVKGKQESRFNEFYESLLKESKISTYECYWRLNQLVGFLKDRHITLAYRAQEEVEPFNGLQVEVPHEMKEQLWSKALNDVEGIYDLSGRLRVAIYKADNPDSLIGVVVESEIPTWQKGEVCMFLKATEFPDSYNVLLSFDKLNMLYRRGLRLQEGSFFSNFRKVNSPGVNQAMIDPDLEPYRIHELQEGISYVWLNSFSNSAEVKKRRDSLLEELESPNISKSLVIDLRNNGGGSDRISKSVFDALKKFTKDKEVFVVTNGFSASNAELFTLKAKRVLNATHIGWRSNGALSYGINYGTSYNLPSDLFSVTPTDMDLSRNLEYELLGIQPEFELESWLDWKEQIIRLVNK